MLEERAHELWVSSNLSESFLNPWPQLFTLFQRASCNAGALDVAPHQLMRIEVRRITGQKVQSQFSDGAGERRLLNVQPLCCSREVEFFGNSLEAAKVA